MKEIKGENINAPRGTEKSRASSLAPSAVFFHLSSFVFFLRVCVHAFLPPSSPMNHRYLNLWLKELEKYYFVYPEALAVALAHPQAREQ